MDEWGQDSNSTVFIPKTLTAFAQFFHTWPTSYTEIYTGLSPNKKHPEWGVVLFAESGYQQGYSLIIPNYSAVLRHCDSRSLYQEPYEQPDLFEKASSPIGQVCYLVRATW